MVNYTTINHVAREQLGLSWPEYCVADLIYNLSNKPDSGGWCIASKEWIGSQLGISKRGVNKIIARLETKNLIKREKYTINRSLGYRLQVTIDWYNTVLIKGGNQEPTTTKRWEQPDQKVGTNVSKRWEPSSHNKDIYNKDTNNTTNVVGAKAPNQPQTYGKPELNAMFTYWQQTTGQAITARAAPNRRAAANLLKKYGAERLQRLIEGVAVAQSDQYAPRIADFTQLQNKVDELILWGKKKSTNQKRTIKV